MITRYVNGIDLNKSRATQDLIRADGYGDIAKPEYQAAVVWNSGYHTTSHVTHGQTVIGDEPVRYGGGGIGITPQDLLLTAIGHCLTATYIGGLSAAGINVASLRLNVSGRVNFRAAYGVEPGSPGFESIRIAVDIKTDAPRKEVEATLAKLLKTAPIPDTIIRPVPLNVEITHHQSGRT